MDARPVLLTHRLVYTTATGEQSDELFEFQSDEMAVLCARSLLSPALIAVGVRRHEPGRRDERVGLWLWRKGRPEWRRGE